jgi:hypothetical protein
VYALGAVLYEALTGQPPFKGDTPLDTLHKVECQKPVTPRRLQPQVPRDLETICLTCLQKQPAERYASAEALAEDLHRFLRSEPIRARPIGIVGLAYKWAQRQPALATVVLLATLGLVGLAWTGQDALQHRRHAELAQQETDRTVMAEQEARQEVEEHLYTHNINLAYREWLNDNVTLAVELLSRCPSRLRDWEWHYLNRICRSARRTVQVPKEPGAALMFRPDGQLLALARRDEKHIGDPQRQLINL